MTRISYHELADLLECSPRNARRIVNANKNKITPIRLGHRTVKFSLQQAIRFKKDLEKSAIQVALHKQPRKLVIKVGGKR